MDMTLNVLKGKAFLNPNVDNLLAYIDALEAHIEDFWDVQKELDKADRRIGELEWEVSELEDELDKAADKLIEYENRLGID